MKAVMLSIQPRWVELIASGKKTVEVRKTKPKIDVPFKCYIYCTKGKDWLTSVNGVVQKPNSIKIDLKTNSKIEELNGKVIGEFVCDKIVEFENSWFDLAFAETSNLSCVGFEELGLYLGGKDFGYGWHISDLVIYDKPKKLWDFIKPCDTPFQCDKCNDLVQHFGCGRTLTRPPQSWCYVEEILPPLAEPKGKTITIPKWEYKE